MYKALIFLAACYAQPDKTDTDTGEADVDTDTDTDTGPVETGETGEPQDVDGDGWDEVVDCDDGDDDVYPGATEWCNGEDDDCDGEVDEGCNEPADADGDGWSEELDCDDGDDDVYPGATELCNDEDDDCDGSVDEGTVIEFYRDEDEDGYGDTAVTVNACSAPTGYVENDDDCNDNDESVHPEAEEDCNDEDDDCDGVDDDGCTDDEGSVVCTWTAPSGTVVDSTTASWEVGESVGSAWESTSPTSTNSTYHTFSFNAVPGEDAVINLAWTEAGVTRYGCESTSTSESADALIGSWYCTFDGATETVVIDHKSSSTADGCEAFLDEIG